MVGAICQLDPSVQKLSPPKTPMGWYAAHTCARHEKRVAQLLEQRSVENFLPLYETVSRWKDRRVRLQLPLFPGYVFVHIRLQDRLQVLQIPSVVGLVRFGGHPVPLPDNDIELLQKRVVGNVPAEPHPYLQVGRRVRVQSGPLEGVEGVLIRKKDRFRVVLSLELIMRSIAVEVDATDVEPAVSGRQTLRGSSKWL